MVDNQHMYPIDHLNKGHFAERFLLSSSLTESFSQTNVLLFLGLGEGGF